MIENKTDILEYKIVDEIVKECMRARTLYSKFNNLHEGYAVLFEEVDELWDIVKLKQINDKRIYLARREAIQIGAMALRIILDCCYQEKRNG